MAFGKGGDRFPEREPVPPLPPLPPLEDDGGIYYGGPAEEYPGDPPPAPPLEPPSNGGPADDGGAAQLPPDQIGDIPPPPAPYIPDPPITGVGVGGVQGTEGSTFARPGQEGARPFRSPAFTPRPRFGPGVPMMSGGAAEPFGVGDDDTPLDPERAAELLRSLATGGG